MVTTGEADNGPVARDALRELQGSFNRGRAGWSDRLDDHIQPARFEDVTLHGFEETAFLDSEGVKTMQQLARSKVFYRDVHEDGVVVAVGKGPGAREKVQILRAILVNDR